ncbi:hypothetical protein M9Y10_017551 [Tritrichomonas musculus]|uniref:BTB domain-containing protein n=1 Tax=Tritrichomonas musculus TaxID=1915356 RepID=A0ABR2HUQ8_9EUKA
MTNKNNKKEEKVSTLSLKVESDCTFLITHNGTNQYHVDPYIFSSFSIFFREKYLEEKVTEYAQKDRTTERVFSIFINLCQGIEQNIQLSDVFSLQRLSESWKCPRLTTELNSLLKGQPEIEVKIAEIVDEFTLTKKLPNQKSIKAAMIESFMETSNFHYIEKVLLMCFMQYAKQKACDKRKLNSFIVDHCRLIPDDSTEIVQYIDAQTLTTNELDFLCNCPGTMMLRIVTDEARRRNKKITEKTAKEKDTENEEEEEEKNDQKETDNSSEKKLVRFKNEFKKEKFLKVTPPLYGLFASIGVECNGNPVLKGKIKISASSNDPSVLVERNDETMIVEGIDPSITLVFPSSFSINKYEIQNTSNSSIIQWSLFGSNDFKKWDLIHSIDNINETFEPNSIRTIKLENETNTYSIFQLKKFESQGIEFESNLNIKYFDVFNDDQFVDGASKKLNVIVTTSSNSLYRLSSPRHRASWYSLNRPNQWVQFEFVDNIIQPDYYTLKSGKCWFLRSWEVVGSLDGVKWFRIDKKVNNTDINSKFAVKLFDTEKSDDCRFIRIIQNENNGGDNINILCLSGVEFFGRIRKYKKPKKKV